MRLGFPLALIGLLSIPYLVWLGRPRGAMRRGRARFALALRILIVVLLVLALAGLQVVNVSDRLAIVFLIDASDSISDQTRQTALEYVDDVLGRMGPDDEAAIIVFGSDALIERPMSSVRELGRVESAPLPHNTDLAQAIRLGLALYPSGSARRMVILSDGLPTVGDAEEAARLAAANGVQIVVVPYSVTRGPEVLVESVGAPTRLEEGQTFDLSITLQSTVETEANLLVLGGGRVLHEETVMLHEGSNRYVLPVVAGQAGMTDFRVQVQPLVEDSFHQNNELAAFSQVTGPSRILVVRQDEANSQHLTSALLETGLLVDQTSAAGLPFDLASLSGYASVVMVDVPATELSLRQMNALRSYVRDLGGGLVTVGGEHSYAVGGYFRTLLEEILPVDMQLKDQERLPQLSIVYVIDKSGSMLSAGIDGTPKIELAKEAISRSVQLLGPLDRVGVVAFDSQSTWVVDLQSVDDPDAIANRVGTLRAGGGTDILDGLLAMSRVLPDDPALLKHVILLTDGGANPAGIEQLVSDLYKESGITLSVVAIGADHEPFIEGLPALADGRFHLAIDPGSIPQIFTEETVLATRAYIIEETFTPTITSPSPIIEGLSGMQPLHGYIGTSIKPTAQQVLETAQGDPLLAAWRFGLGRSVAWSSDATGRWAVNWISWTDFPRFWSQAVRWTISEGVNQNVEISIVPEGKQATVTIDALDRDGNFLNGLELEATLIRPGLDAEPLTLQQVAPGRYQAEFEPDDPGAYFVRVTGSGEAQALDGLPSVVAQTSGWVMAYSPEYNLNSADPRYLANLAALTGGDVVADPADILAHNLAVDDASQPIWPWLLLAALLLLPIDIAVRRLVITRSDLNRGLQALGLSRRQALAEAALEVRTSRVGALLDVKQRIRRQPSDITVPPSPTTAQTADSAPSARRSRPAAFEESAAADQPGALAARLLKSKRTRQPEQDPASGEGDS